MNSNRSQQKHWTHISSHFLLDAALFAAAFYCALRLRFGPDFPAGRALLQAMLAGAFGFSATVYIFGLYSTHSAGTGVRARAVVLTFCAVLGSALIVAATYVQSARPPGRGVVLIGAGLALLGTFIHHLYLLHRLRSFRECVGYVVTCAFDEAEGRLFHSLGARQLSLVGLIESEGYTAADRTRVLGKTTHLAEIVRRHHITRVLCTDKSINDPSLSREFCQLRYSGVTVMPLINLCEEIYQCVPLELITSDWLLTASGEPHLFYIKKVKRFFDILISLAGLLASWPLLVLAMLAVKLSSRGPVFYRQARGGRFGKPFQITKLRTMRADAEKHSGAVWWSGAADPRVTPVGRFLRKYRIDEIPQLLHVLAGDMSFVGPRPERPEIIETLGREIPHYHERLLIQPGITGWAQVSYPYGASVEDARRKLEYDLYYMKHMGLFLDTVILLDTVRTVLFGGVGRAGASSASRIQTMIEWQKLKTESGEPPFPIPAAEPGYIMRVHLGEIVKIPIQPRARAKNWIPRPESSGTA